MSIDFHLSTAAKGPPIASLTDEECAVANASLDLGRIPWQLDNYGTTKLADANVVQLLRELEVGGHTELALKLNALSGHEVIYAIGD